MKCTCGGKTLMSDEQLFCIRFPKLPLCLLALQIPGNLHRRVWEETDVLMDTSVWFSASGDELITNFRFCLY